jgi:HEAT repeat protein
VTKHRVAADPVPGRQQLASSWMAGLGSSPASAEIVAHLMSTDRVRRESFLTICGILAEGAIPILFRALNECPTRSIRLELCELLVSLKEPTAAFLVTELERRDIPWYFQRNLLNLLGRVGDESLVGVAQPFMRDRHARVRLEALLTTCALDPANAEHHLVLGLGDADPDIRGVSLRQLVQRRSTSPEIFDHVRAVLGNLDEADRETGRQICTLLASYQAGEGYDQAVDLLLDILQDDDRKGLWSRLKSDSEGRDFLKVAACQALGRLRARRAVSVLSKLSQGKNRALRLSAVQALRFIQQTERV